MASFLCAYLSKWVFPKIVGFPPKASIKRIVGFPIVFTIHFGVFPYFWKHPNVIDKGFEVCTPFFFSTCLGWVVGWFQWWCWPWCDLRSPGWGVLQPTTDPSNLDDQWNGLWGCGGWWWSWWWWRGKGKQEMWICGGWLASCFFSDWSDETVLQLDMIGWRHKRRRYLWCRCVLQMLERQSVYHKGLCFQDIGSTYLHSHIWTL